MPAPKTNPRRQAPRLGQNFLVSTTAPRAIVEALGDLSESTVLEIGPGQGVLTELLAPRAKQVVAVEVDALLAARLETRWPREGNVEVVHRDFLHWDIGAWAGQHGTRLKVIGNLPYYISSPILMHVFAHSSWIDRAVLMTQREVAERITAAPGSSEYGLLSATTQMYASVENLFTLPPEAFSPPPKVFSTVFRLTMQPRFAELAVEPGTFLPFLQKAFMLKRKTLVNNLRAAGHEPAVITAAFRTCGIDLQVRAESLPLEAMAALHCTLG